MMGKYWPAIVAATVTAVIVIPISFSVGSWHGARNERVQAEQRVLLSSAKNDVQTVSELSKVVKAYEPIYVEIEKYVEVPTYPVPAVIADTIKRLPGSTKAKD